MKEKCEGQRTLRLKLDDEASFVQLSKVLCSLCLMKLSYEMKGACWVTNEGSFRDAEGRNFWG
jgi:hypothetical protein